MENDTKRGKIYLSEFGEVANNAGFDAEKSSTDEKEMNNSSPKVSVVNNTSSFKRVKNIGGILLNELLHKIIFLN